MVIAFVILLVTLFVSIVGAQDVQTGTITAASASCTPQNCIFIQLQQNQTTTVAVQVVGAFTGTLKPERTVDGTTWVVAGADITAPGVATLAVAGIQEFRLRASALSAGTPVVTLVRSRAAAGNVTNGSGAPAGSCSDDDLYVDNDVPAVYACAVGSWGLVTGGSAPGGPDQSVQFNDAGMLDGIGPGEDGEYVGFESGAPVVLTPGLPARTDADGTAALLNTDRGKQVNVTNASANAVSIAQAGTGTAPLDFGAGYVTRLCQMGAGAVTVTATTSTFNITGTVSFSWNQENTCALVRSNGTNYEVVFLPAAAGETTYTKSFSIITPTTTQTNLVRFPLSISNATITRVRCDTTTATSTATIQLDERAPTTPNTAGTNVLTSAIACDTDEQATTSFTNAGITGRNLINVQITATANTPAVVNFTIEYKVP